MKKLLVLFLISLLFACANPDSVTLDIPTGIPPVASLPDGGTDTDNGNNGGTDEPAVGRPEHPDREPIFDRPDRPPVYLPDPIRDPNDPWQNLQIGYFTPNAVGLRRYQEFATEDLTGFGFTEDLNDKIEINGFYFNDNTNNSTVTYETIRQPDYYDESRNLWYLTSKGGFSNALIPNFESGASTYKESFYYERAELNNPSEKFRSNLPIGKTCIQVYYRPDDTKMFVYLFKETNQGYGKLELVGYKIYSYSNGKTIVKGDTKIGSPYIKSDYDPR